MWDHIVAQLPPKPPKLVPVISCCKVDGPTSSLYERYHVSISKAVSEKEVLLLVPSTVDDSQKKFFYTGRDALIWGIPLSMDLHTLDRLVRNASMLGWDFMADGDRANYDKRERFFRLVKK